MPKPPRRKLFKFNDNNSSHINTNQDSRTNSTNIRDRRLTP